MASGQIAPVVIVRQAAGNSGDTVRVDQRDSALVGLLDRAHRMSALYRSNE